MNERVKKIRKTLKLTMEKFGERVGVTRSAMSNIENGNRSLTDQMVKSICREFNVSENWLRNGIGEMFISLTKDEEIAKFIGSVQSVEDDTFKKKLISVLAKLNEQEWELLEKMAIRLLNEKED